MKLKLRIDLLILSLLLIISGRLSGQERLISKAVEEIQSGNFIKAEEQLESAKKKSSDNPFYLFTKYRFYASLGNAKFNIDSAHVYLLKSEESLKALREDQLQKYCNEHQVCSKSFTELKNNVAEQAYHIYAQSNSVSSLMDYKEKYSAYPFINIADEKIDSILYQNAESENTIKAFEKYLSITTKNIFLNAAKQRIQSLAYEKAIKINSVEAYKDYLKLYALPEQTAELWGKIYEIAWNETLKLNTAKRYLEYHKDYPDSPYSRTALKLYKEKALLVPFLKANGKYIYVDSELMEPVITQEFDEAAFFIGNYAIVKTQSTDALHSGIINKTGEIVVQCNYDRITLYQDLAILNTGKKYSIYNCETGKLTEFESEYDYFGYGEGIFVLQDRSLSRSGTFFFMDKQFKRLFGRNFYMAGEFQNGLAWVMREEDYYTGYINKSGSIQIPYMIIRSGGPEEKIERVRVNVNNKWGLTDYAGTSIVGPIFNEMNPFYDGLSLVKTEKYGFIDKNGKVVIPIKYDDARDFTMGLAIVGITNANQVMKFGVIDNSGKIIFQPKYDGMISFSEGMSGFRIGSKWGFLNSFGKEIVEAKYDDVNSFHDGLAAVKLNENWGFINKDGAQIVEFKYYLPYDSYDSIDFKNGFAKVNKPGFGKIYIDKIGREYAE
jgi:hypothetical protein